MTPENFAQHYYIAPHVRLGNNTDIGPWVEVGSAPRGYRLGELPLEIGDHAIVRSHTVIYAGSTIGHHFATGHGALIREAVTIGDNVSIGAGSEISPKTVIGNNVRIHTRCFIAESSIIEDGVRIAPGTITADLKHPLLPEEKKIRRGPHIKRGAYIGIGVKILPGICIGEGSLVGAGSVVVDDVPPGVVVFGNPAKVYMKLEEYLARLAKIT